MNAARPPDGSFRANTTDLFFKNQKRLGRLYRQELAHELTGRGFQVTVKDRARLFIELKGIDPALIQTRNLERLRALPSFQSTASPSSVDWLIERVSEEEGRPLTAGHKAEVFNELTGERGVTLTLGDPGAAKTTTLKVIERFNERVLRPYGEEHLSINLAYTAKAAREVARPPGDLPAPSTVSKTPTRLPNLSYRGKKGSRPW